ncbi:unnamed protein product [Rotaria sp. Silwood2]|nr:unnamed protein product [Rotaria sp. Silwood2]
MIDALSWRHMVIVIGADSFHCRYISKEQPLKIELPDQWLWDIIEEFIYQFQSFCNFRTKLAKRSDDDIEQLKRNIKIWNVHAVLNVMHSLVDKSRIVEQLEAARKGVSFNPGSDLFCQTNLYKMFGYFSLIGLLKLHTLTSDYYMALKTIECIDLYVTKQNDFCQVFHCIVATNYHAGFCYTMMRNYEDAIRVFVDTLLYIQRSKPIIVAQTFQNDAVNKTADQMMTLLAICLTLNPIRIDETIYLHLREKFLDKLPKPLLWVGPDGKLPFRDSFAYVAPLFVIEFLHRIMDVFEDYFGECTETSLKDNYVIVYELLDEMLDSGLPLATETNILKELIKPPNIFRKVANLVTGDNTNISNTLPSSQLSNIPWRRMGVKYTNNEAYFDLIEEIDAIIDRNGATIMCEIQGYIDCCVKLSGMPDLTLSFVNPRLLDDVSFHPCVRLKKWESERVLSFIPPDGNFRLISYHIGSQNTISIPIYVKHNIQFREGSSGRFELTVGPKQTMGKTLEAVVIECTMPKSVLNCTLTPTQGKSTFDPVKKILVWDIGKIESNAQSAARLPSLRGNIVLSTGQPIPESNPILNVRFTLNQIAISGIRVQRVDMHGEKYKPFKGVKYITTVGKGRFQIRT